MSHGITNDQSTLMCLPDDVLIRILGKLSPKTQFMMTDLHIRFLALMPHVWRSHCRIIDFYNIELPLSDKELHFFLRSNQRTFEVLNLPSHYIFDVFTNYVFPNLHDLTLGLNYRFDARCLLKATKIFPNLKSLTVRGYFTGEHFEKFAQLESLTLTDCIPFKVSYLPRILETCRLKTLNLGQIKPAQLREIELFEGIQFLVVLKCSIWDIDMFKNNLNNLAHLKQFILTDNCTNKKREDVIYDVITSANRKTIQSIELNIKKINFLKIIDINTKIKTMKVMGTTIPYFWELNRGYKAIGELYLKECTFFKEEFLEILINSFNILEVLVLDSCRFACEEFTFLAHQIANGRHTKLDIYLYNNAYIDTYNAKEFPMRWKVSGQHRLLEVHMEEKLNISYGTEEFSIFFE